MAGEKRTPSARQLALCGVLAALALAMMLAGGLIPAATYCCPVLACILLIPVLDRCGRRIAWAWFAAVALLSCLLCPNPEAAALFLFLGYYPILKSGLDRIRLRPLRYLTKLALFNSATAAMYAALIFLLGWEELTAELQESSLALLALTLVLGNLTFCLTDLLLTRLERLYQNKISKKLP